MPPADCHHARRPGGAQDPNGGAIDYRVAFLTIDADRLRESIPMPRAIDALEEAFMADRPLVPQRQRVAAGSGDLLLMPAASPSGIGVKLVTINRSNRARGLPTVQGTYTLFDADSLAPVAVIDGAALTVLRTGAVSGLATRHLAKPDARSLVIFGTGPQAHSHLEAMVAVRPVETLSIVPRSGAGVNELVEHGRSLGLEVTIATPAAVQDADLVCTCTTSSTPVFDGRLLRAGAHVNAMGAYHPDTRELDDAAVQNGKVVVEDREMALAEAGDLLIPISRGLITASHIVCDLTELLLGQRVRTSGDDITIFKSVGMALEDLAVALAVFSRARG
jgi:ornithine cyclodeaminase/alanine dehydrogenase-like protein (mu-crystallin family)